MTKSKKSQQGKETEKLARMIRYIVYGFIGAIIFVFLVALFSVSDSTYPDTEVKTVPGKAELVLDNLEVSGTSTTIDTVEINFNNITLKNIGDSSFGGYDGKKIILKVVVNNKSKSAYDYVTIPPGETRSVYFRYLSDSLSDWSFEIERQPGEFEFSGNIIIEDESEEILDTKNFSFSIPSAEIGDTLLLDPRVSDSGVSRIFDITINSWQIEPSRWSPDKMKYIVLNATIKNSYLNRRSEMPQIFASIITTKGYVEHGDLSTLSFEDLYPEEEISGEIKVRIPSEWEPAEMSIVYVDEIISLS